MQLPFGAQAATYYPLDTELFFLWLMKPWHSDFIVNAGQVPYWALCGLAVAAIARETGVGRSGAVTAGVAAMLFPGVVQQATVARVDIAMSAWLLLSIYFAARWAKTRKGAHLVLFGLCGGLLVGTKSIGVLYSVVPGLVFLGGLRGRKARAVSDIAVVAGAALAAGGFWYVRNWIVTGNPFFPLDLEIAGMRVFAGAYGSEAMQLFRAKDHTVMPDILRFFMGLPMTFLVMFSSAAATLAILLGRREGSEKLFMLAAPWILMALFWFVNPYNNLTNGRFLFPAFMLLCYPAGVIVHEMRGAFSVSWALLAAAAIIGSNAMPGGDHLPRLLSDISGGAAAAAGVAVTELPGWIPWAVCLALAAVVVACRRMAPAAAALAVAALAVACMWSILNTKVQPNELLAPAQQAVALLVASACFFIAFLFARRRRVVSYLALALSAALLVAGARGAFYYHLEHKYDWYKAFPVGAAWARLDEMTRGDSLTIAAVGNERMYGLFGTGLRHRVAVVNVEGGNEKGFHDYWREARGEGLAPASTDRPQWHRDGGSPEAWFANLHAAGAGFVFATTLEPMARSVMKHNSLGFPPEVDWAASRPDLFRIKYANSEVRIFAVSPDIGVLTGQQDR